MTDQPANVPVRRIVDIRCLRDLHAQSIATFRNHTTVVMFCEPCEVAWLESATHPLLHNLPVDRLCN